MSAEANSPMPFRGAVAGFAAGLAASVAMNLFQRLWAQALPMPQSEDPSTVKAAQKASRMTTGKYVSEEDKPFAGNVVHFAFGGGLGAAYGLIAEYRPSVTDGLGIPFGLAAAALFDEAAVPAAGLSRPATKIPMKRHLYGIASHVVYGGVTEGVRRLLRAGSAARFA